MVHQRCGDQETGVDTEAQTGGEGMKPERFQWIREPETWKMDGEGRLEVITVPCTDLWQKNYYHLQNDSAPVFHMQTVVQYFSFVVKSDFEDCHH